MIRILPSFRILALVVLAAPFAASQAAAQAGGANQAAQLETSGAWGAYASQQGRGKVCYALSQPRSRLPEGLNRDPAYLFVSIRPAEKVRGEISLLMGFPTRDTTASEAIIGDRTFALVTKEGQAWLRNPAEEPQFVQALAAGAELQIKVSSARGNSLTDVYSLSGFTKTWDRVGKECS